MKKILTAGAAVMLGACVEPADLRAMTDEERVIVDDLLVRGKSERMMAEALIDGSTNGEFFGFDGVHSKEAAMDAMDESTARFEELYRDGKVYVFDEQSDTLREKADSENGAEGFAEEKLFEGPYVALYGPLRHSWSYGLFAHEAAHVLGSADHGDAVVARYGTDFLSPEFMRAAVEEGDVAFMLTSMVYGAQDEVLDSQVNGYANLIQYVEEKVVSGEYSTEQARAVLDGDTTFDTARAWAEWEAMEFTLSHRDWLEFLGVDDETFIDAMAESGMYEYATERRGELRAEAERWFESREASEASTERRRSEGHEGEGKRR